MLPYTYSIRIPRKVADVPAIATTFNLGGDLVVYVSSMSICEHILDPCLSELKYGGRIHIQPAFEGFFDELNHSTAFGKGEDCSSHDIFQWKVSLEVMGMSTTQHKLEAVLASLRVEFKDSQGTFSLTLDDLSYIVFLHLLFLFATVVCCKKTTTYKLAYLVVYVKLRFMFILKLVGIL